MAQWDSFSFTLFHLNVQQNHYTHFKHHKTTLLLHIREVLGSNLGSVTGYPDRGFLWF
jgi:hypothetical protein